MTKTASSASAHAEAASGHSGPLEEKSLSEKAYRRLRQDIVEGHLEPGSKLKIEVLVKDYQIGMSPLREGLMQLASERLVIFKAQRGYWVAPVSQADFLDIMSMRKVLECEALERALQFGDEAWENQITLAYEALDAIETAFPQDSRSLSEEEVRGWQAANRDFHMALISACNSPWLIRLCQQMYQHAARYRRLTWMQAPVRPSVHDEHRAIYASAMQHNVLKACRYTERHFDGASEDIAQVII